MTLLRVCLTIAFAAGLTILAIAQGDNPHGDIKFDCATCHSTSNWKDIPARPSFVTTKPDFRFPANTSRSSVRPVTVI